MVVAALIVDGLFSARRPDPDRPAAEPRRHLRHDRGRLQALPQRVRPGRLRRAVLAQPRAPSPSTASTRDCSTPHGRGIGSLQCPSARPTDKSQSGASSVSYEGATKRYGDSDAAAVDHLTLEVPAGEICVLVGPSGCGKTTAMRMVNRMVEITEGDILIGGESVRDRDPAQLRREIGYVIQQIGLFPHRTIAENIGAVPQLLGWKKDRDPGPHRRAAGADRARPRARRPLPGAALRRPAAARRRRPGARRRPAGDADGRALRRDRPDQPRAPAERVPAPAGGDPQDRPLRHPRHRRGDQDGRPDRDPARGRQGRAVRDPGRDADGAGRPSSSRTSSAPTGR